MSNRRILVVEDEEAIAEAVGARLVSEGYDVRVVHDGPEALRATAVERPDLVVLDLMLPGMDGLEVCREIQREEWIPVLMLTARADEADKVAGFAVGADDYLTKPFSLRELVARVRVLLRRVERAQELAKHAPAGRISVGTLGIDRARREVTVAGDLVHLTPTEFDLLVCLAEQPGTVLTREHLLEEVWDWPDAATRTVDSHVKSLRAKIGSTFVRTVHGVGYALETP